MFSTSSRVTTLLTLIALPPLLLSGAANAAETEHGSEYLVIDNLLTGKSVALSFERAAYDLKDAGAADLLIAHKGNLVMPCIDAMLMVEPRLAGKDKAGCQVNVLPIAPYFADGKSQTTSMALPFIDRDVAAVPQAKDYPDGVGSLNWRDDMWTNFDGVPIEPLYTVIVLPEGPFVDPIWVFLSDAELAMLGYWFDGKNWNWDWPDQDKGGLDGDDDDYGASYDDDDDVPADDDAPDDAPPPADDGPAPGGPGGDDSEEDECVDTGVPYSADCERQEIAWDPWSQACRFYQVCTPVCMGCGANNVQYEYDCGETCIEWNNTSPIIEDCDGMQETMNTCN